MLDILQRFKVFSSDAPKDTLQNIATKDLASEEIQLSLLNASNFGQEEIMKFVRDRILPPPAGEEPPCWFLRSNKETKCTNLRKPLSNP